MSNYTQKLKNPKWQKRRLAVLERAKWRCEDCGEDASELQVYHCAYVRALEPWEHGDDLLMCLCAVAPPPKSKPSRGT
jgi:hypothetical protein